MTPRTVDLLGLSQAEAEAKVREFVVAIQEEALANYEIRMIDDGVDREDVDCELARYRGELAVLREHTLARLHALFENRREKLSLTTGKLTGAGLPNVRTSLRPRRKSAALRRPRKFLASVQ